MWELLTDHFRSHLCHRHLQRAISSTRSVPKTATATGDQAAAAQRIELAERHKKHPQGPPSLARIPSLAPSTPTRSRHLPLVNPPSAHLSALFPLHSAPSAKSPSFIRGLLVLPDLTFAVGPVPLQLSAGGSYLILLPSRLPAVCFRRQRQPALR